LNWYYFSAINSYVVISLGSNLGDSQEILKKSFALMNAHDKIEVIRESKFYASQPWGFDSCNQFVNACCILRTGLTPGGVLIALQRIEKELGRAEKNIAGYEDRAIDLDIIFYNHLVLRSESLVIPHRLMHVRNFVLEPLAEISPDWVHPVYLKSVAELLAACTDSDQVNAL